MAVCATCNKEAGSYRVTCAGCLSKASEVEASYEERLDGCVDQVKELTEALAISEGQASEWQEASDGWQSKYEVLKSCCDDSAYAGQAVEEMRKGVGYLKRIHDLELCMADVNRTRERYKGYRDRWRKAARSLVKVVKELRVQLNASDAITASVIAKHAEELSAELKVSDNLRKLAQAIPPPVVDTIKAKDVQTVHTMLTLRSRIGDLEANLAAEKATSREAFLKVNRLEAVVKVLKDRLQSTKCVVTPTKAEMEAIGLKAANGVYRTQHGDLIMLLRDVRDAICAFEDPEGNMPEDTGEFRGLSSVLEQIQARVGIV